MNAMIDTLKTAKTFEDAGFAKPQAEMLAVTIAEAMRDSREELVTKDYLKAELAIIRTEIKAEIAGVRTEIAGVRTEIAASKNDVVRWLFASQLILLVALVALANFTKLLN